MYPHCQCSCIGRIGQQWKATQQKIQDFKDSFVLLNPSQDDQIRRPSQPSAINLSEMRNMKSLQTPISHDPSLDVNSLSSSDHVPFLSLTNEILQSSQVGADSAIEDSKNARTIERLDCGSTESVAMQTMRIPPQTLDGKVAICTGASRGLGAEIGMSIKTV